MQCHCYVCECRAPCPLWNSDSVISNDRHCHATYKEERWKTLKKQLLNKRNPINVQRPSASLRTGRQDLTELDKLGQLLDSLSQSLTSLEQLLKKKKGQIFKGWRLKLLLRLMKAEVQVSLNIIGTILLSSNLYGRCYGCFWVAFTNSHSSNLLWIV